MNFLIFLIFLTYNVVSIDWLNHEKYLLDYQHSCCGEDWEHCLADCEESDNPKICEKADKKFHKIWATN